MARPCAFPAEQEEWLETEYPKYEKKVHEGSGPSFMKQTKNRFVKRFAIPKETQTAVKKQIDNYLRAKFIAAQKQLTNEMRTANAAITHLILGELKPLPRPKQDLQPVQAFMKMHLDTYRSDLQEAWNADQLKQGIKTDKETKPNAGFRTRFMGNLLKIQPQDVQDEVSEFIKQAHETAMAEYETKMQAEGLLLPEDLSLDSEEQDKLVDARTKIKCLQNLPTVLAAIVQTVEKFTGLVMHCFVGGPDCERNGRVGVWHTGSGKAKSDDCTFEERKKAELTAFIEEWKRFAKSCFTSDDCQKVAEMVALLAKVQGHAQATPTEEPGAVDAGPSTRAVLGSTTRQNVPSSTDDVDKAPKDDDEDSGNETDDDAPSIFENPDKLDITEQDVIDDDDPAQQISSPPKTPSHPSLQPIDTTDNGNVLLPDGFWRTAYEHRNLLAQARNRKLERQLDESLGLHATIAEMVPEPQALPQFTPPPPRQSIPRAAKLARPSVAMDTVVPDEDEEELIDIDEQPSAPSPATPAVKNSAVADDQTSSEEDSPSYRPPALVVSPTLASKVKHGAPLSVVDRLDMLVSGQLTFYMKGTFDLLRTELRTTGGAEALLAWAKVQPSIDSSMPEGRLSAQNRPRQVHDWLKRNRLLALVPAISSTTKYRDQWRSWYHSLMPAWRHTADSKNWPLLRGDHPDEAWPALMVSGPNGIQIIFMTLYWWSRAVKKSGGDDAEDEDLESALKDLAWTLEAMLSSDVLASSASDTSSRPLLSPSKVLTSDIHHVVVRRTRATRSSTKLPDAAVEDAHTSVTKKENDPSSLPTKRKAAQTGGKRKRART